MSDKFINYFDKLKEANPDHKHGEIVESPLSNFLETRRNKQVTHDDLYKKLENAMEKLPIGLYVNKKSKDVYEILQFSIDENTLNVLITYATFVDAKAIPWTRTIMNFMERFDPK